MFKVIVLICSVNLEPAMCTEDTAIDFVLGPPVASVMECAFQGQARLATTSVAPEMGKTYQKTICVLRADDAAK